MIGLEINMPNIYKNKVKVNIKYSFFRISRKQTLKNYLHESLGCKKYDKSLLTKSNKAHYDENDVFNTFLYHFSHAGGYI